MKNAVATQFAAKYQVTQTVFILAATMILPLIIHLIPNINGNLAGAVLLPIFWAPMFAAFVYKKHVAILAGIFAPLLNYLILGRPVPEMVVTLNFEIVLFALLLSWAKNLNIVRYVAAPLTYVVASILTVACMSFFSDHASLSMWVNSTVIAIPGIVLMGLANFAFLRFSK
jgi:hypothetical protein